MSSAVFSHSKLSTFEKCRLEFKYAYIDRLPTARHDTIEAFLGSCVHESLEKLYTDIRHQKSMNLDDLKQDFNQRWEKNWDDSIIIVKSDYGPDNYRRMGERYLEDYHRRHHPFKEGRILGLETKDVVTLDSGGRYRFHVRIDRLMDLGGGLYEIHDYKTNMKLPSQEDLDNDRQLAAYSLWVKERFPDLQRIRLVWHFLAFDKEMESCRTSEQLERLRQDIIDSIAGIEKTREYPPNVGPLCSWCLYQDICPEWSHDRSLKSLPENDYLKDDGLVLVDEYIRIKNDLEETNRKAQEKLDKIKEALIRFGEAHEVTTVFGSDRKINIRRYRNIKFPAKNSPDWDRLVQYLYSVDKYDPVSNLDTASLNRIMEEEVWDTEVMNEIRKYVEEETVIRLYVANQKK